MLENKMPPLWLYILALLRHLKSAETVIFDYGIDVTMLLDKMHAVEYQQCAPRCVRNVNIDVLRANLNAIAAEGFVDWRDYSPHMRNGKPCTRRGKLHLTQQGVAALQQYNADELPKFPEHVPVPKLATEPVEQVLGRGPAVGRVTRRDFAVKGAAKPKPESTEKPLAAPVEAQTPDGSVFRFASVEIAAEFAAARARSR